MRRTTPPEGDVLSRLPCPYIWDDLVVTAELRTQLQEFAAQTRLRLEVYENWGLRNSRISAPGLPRCSPARAARKDDGGTDPRRRA